MKKRVYCELEDWGFLGVFGTDAKKLLQGQLTCNLDDITTGKSLLAAHCNPQGRVISLFHIFLWQDGYLLFMPKTLSAIALTALKKYAVFFKAQLKIVDEYSVIGTTKVLTDKETIALANTQRYLIFNASNELLSQFEKVTSAEWRALDIDEGIPAIYPETAEKFLPHELNLPELNAVSFNKGCYTGQEIIARMQYKGKVKNTLQKAKVEINQTLTCGDDIYNQTGPAGSIVDWAPVGYNKYNLLILTRPEEFALGLYLDAEKKIKLETGTWPKN